MSAFGQASANVRAAAFHAARARVWRRVSWVLLVTNLLTAAVLGGVVLAGAAGRPVTDLRVVAATPSGRLLALEPVAVGPKAVGPRLARVVSRTSPETGDPETGRLETGDPETVKPGRERKEDQER